MVCRGRFLTLIVKAWPHLRSRYFDFPQLFSMSLYAFFETVDFFFGLDVPFFFFALILLTNEFLTPSLFFPLFFAAFLRDVFFAAFFGDLVTAFFFGRPGDFFLVAIVGF